MSWEQIFDMTPYQLKFMLADMAVKADRENKELEKVKHSGRSRRRR